MPDPTDLPTPEQVATYLEARGWHLLREHPRSDKEDLWVHPVEGAVFFHRKRFHLMDSLDEVARIEGRPTPAEQVRRDMVNDDAAAAAAAPAMDGWRKAVRDE